MNYNSSWLAGRQCRRISAAPLLIILIGCSIGLYSFASPSPAPPAVIPPPAEILARLTNSHPRLLASRQDFLRLKETVKTDEQLRKWHASLTREAQAILQQSPSKYEIPDGLRLLVTSRRVLNRVYTLALCYQLEGRTEYIDRAWKELEAAAAFPDWNPRLFLDSAEMTHAFAIAYDWLYDAWTPQQRTLIGQAIVLHGLKPAAACYEEGVSWTKV